MPIDTSGLTRAFKKLGDQFESKDPVYRAVIVSDDEENNWTVDFLNPDSSIGTRRSVKGNGYYWQGLQVRISRQRKIWGDDYWVIMGADMTVYLSEAPPETLALHGWTHGWDQPDETTNLSTFQVYSLRVQPADPADQTVDVLTGIYYAGGAFHYLAAVTNVDLAAYIAALGFGQRQYLVLSIDSAETINITEGTPKVGVLDASDIPDPPIDERALCAVDIRNGDTAIERERVYADLRWLAGGVPVDPVRYAIVLYSGGAVEYDVDDAGMAAAIAAAGAGDTIEIPPTTLANDYTIPSDVTVTGKSVSDVVFSGQITLDDGAILEHLSITISENDGNTYYGIIGPSGGVAYVKQCWVNVTQAGGGAGYGVSCFDRNGDLHIYGGKVFGSTADVRENSLGEILFFGTEISDVTDNWLGITFDDSGNLRASGAVYEGP